jgi:hypothetical protein
LTLINVPDRSGQTVRPPVFLELSMAGTIRIKRPHSHSVCRVLVYHRNFSRISRSRLYSVSVNWAISSSHVELGLHRNVAVRLLDLIITGEEDHALFRGEQGKLIKAFFIECGQVDTSNSHTNSGSQLNVSPCIHQTVVPLRY